MKKICVGCNENKFIYEYWKDSNALDGKRSRCKTCLKKENEQRYKNSKNKYEATRKKYYQKNKETIKKKTKEWVENNLEKKRIYDKTYYRNMDNEKYENALKRKREFDKTEKGKKLSQKSRVGPKWIARYTFRNAIRDGKIKKQDKCSFCLSEKLVEGHHPDYSKPLEVIWMCRKCHSSLHKSLKER